MWLREDEREYVKARLRADQGHNAAERTITLRDVGSVLTDFRVILGGLMYFGLIVPVGSCQDKVIWDDQLTPHAGIRLCFLCTHHHCHVCDSRGQRL